MLASAFSLILTNLNNHINADNLLPNFKQNVGKSPSISQAFFPKRSILDVWQGEEASEFGTKILLWPSLELC